MDWPPTSAWQDRPARRPTTRRWVSHSGHETFTQRHRRLETEPATWLEEPALAPNRLVTLDGSSGEGGGQILRTALSLSLLSGRPFRIVKIRANREKLGLRPQHLKAVEACALLCGGDVQGASVGSRELTFRPAPYTPHDLTIDIGTAGSTCLILQTLHLPLALRAEKPVRLVLTGGTFNPKAPAYTFLERTWCSHMAAFGLPVALAMPSAGFYPRGGGRLEAWIEPAAGEPNAWIARDRAPLTRIHGVAGVSNLDTSIAERMVARARWRLASLGCEAEISLARWPSPGQGAAIALTAQHGAETATFVGLGERGKPAETVADEAADALLAHERSAGVVDEHSADQILLPLALAPGRSEYTVTTVTEHLRTNAATISAFLDRRIRIHEHDDTSGHVVIE